MIYDVKTSIVNEIDNINQMKPKLYNFFTNLLYCRVFSGICLQVFNMFGARKGLGNITIWSELSRHKFR